MTGWFWEFIFSVYQEDGSDLFIATSGTKEDEPISFGKATGKTPYEALANLCNKLNEINIKLRSEEINQ